MLHAPLSGDGACSTAHARPRRAQSFCDDAHSSASTAPGNDAVTCQSPWIAFHVVRAPMKSTVSSVSSVHIKGALCSWGCQVAHTPRITALATSELRKFHMLPCPHNAWGSGVCATAWGLRAEPRALHICAVLPHTSTLPTRAAPAGSQPRPVTHAGGTRTPLTPCMA